MKSVLGFGSSGIKESGDDVVVMKETETPVRSLVSVRFIGTGRTFTYYNDKFRLEVGDRVFVSGRLAGKPGIVEKITVKFKINLADYQRVIAKACSSAHGTFETVMDKMVSYDRHALSPDEFRTWVIPPRWWGPEEETENAIVVGDGYELSISHIEASDEVDPNVFNRAVEYCQEGRVAYISVADGIGTAFIEGTTWYEVNFRLDEDMMTEMYCDCPYPGLCKHLLAVALTLRALEKSGLDRERDFVAIGSVLFWDMAARTIKRITL